MKLSSNTFVRTFVRGGGGNLATNPYNIRERESFKVL